MTELTGRELDEACALALGVKKSDSGLYFDQSGHTIPLYRYSLDTATQAEKLAWLKQFGSYVEITMWTEGIGMGGADNAVDAKLGGTIKHRLDMTVYGSTIDEALARLICAVAKEQAK